MGVVFNSAARVILVWQKATHDRSRPDDSILLLICVLGRFDKQVVRRSLERLGGRTWFWGAMGEGTVREMG